MLRKLISKQFDVRFAGRLRDLRKLRNKKVVSDLLQNNRKNSCLHFASCGIGMGREGKEMAKASFITRQAAPNNCRIINAG